MRAVLFTLILLGVFGLKQSAAGELVVVEAHGVDLVPGQTVDDGQPLVLRDGQRVTLLAANGNVMKLRGPYEQAPAAAAAADASLSQSLSGLLVQSRARTSEVGVVRANNVQARLPDPWLIDVERAGTFCVRGDKPIVFWREASRSQANVSVTSLDRSWKITATWAEGADQLKMLDMLMPQRRATYLVEVEGNRAAITLNNVPAAVHTDQMRLAWMIEKGCQAQAEALSRTLQ
ncbi:MAG TPA: hypothetical protein VET85_02710 [Stellaceae bacterium]|nr:hypothetical protein [Stellaceae bacterium]